MSENSLADEAALKAVLTDFVENRLPLGVYDPLQPRRPRMAVTSFAIELLEAEEETNTIHAAGPVVLRTPTGDVENHLRLSVEIAGDPAAGFSIPEGAAVRAAYVVETDPSSGACKETAALANV